MVVHKGGAGRRGVRRDGGHRGGGATQGGQGCALRRRSQRRGGARLSTSRAELCPRRTAIGPTRNRTQMPKKKARGRKGLREKGAEDVDKEKEAFMVKLLAERELSAIDNPHFSEDRCPRYRRINKVAQGKNYARITGRMDELAERSGGTISDTAWKKLAADELAKLEAGRREDDENRRLLNPWYLTVMAEEIRTLPNEEAKRDGYVHALLIIHDKHTVTVGQSIPLEGETSAHYTEFLCDYETPEYASMAGSADGAGHEGEDGVIRARTLNDCVAVVTYELAQVARKRLRACALLDRALAGHLNLHAAATGKMDEMRRALLQLESVPSAYKRCLELLEVQINSIVKNLLEAQRAGALTCEQYLRDTVGLRKVTNEHGEITYRFNKVYNEHGEEIDIDFYYGEERPLSDPRFERQGIGADLVRAMTTSIGPHVTGVNWKQVSLEEQLVDEKRWERHRKDPKIWLQVEHYRQQHSKLPGGLSVGDKVEATFSYSDRKGYFSVGDVGTVNGPCNNPWLDQPETRVDVTFPNRSGINVRATGLRLVQSAASNALTTKTDGTTAVAAVGQRGPGHSVILDFGAGD